MRTLIATICVVVAVALGILAGVAWRSCNRLDAIESEIMEPTPLQEPLK